VNPLIRNGQKLIPSVTRVFSKQHNMYVYLQAYQRRLSDVQPLVAMVSFYRGQEKAFETEPVEISEATNGRLKTVPLDFDIPLDKLAPGKYECQVTVLNPTEQRAAFWRAPVLIVP
jgi:hypothetical protein